LNAPNSILESISLRHDAFISSKTRDEEVSVILAEPQNLDTASGVEQLASGNARMTAERTHPS
jgi:hypothetical protein